MWRVLVFIVLVVAAVKADAAGDQSPEEGPKTSEFTCLVSKNNQKNPVCPLFVHLKNLKENCTGACVSFSVRSSLVMELVEMNYTCSANKTCIKYKKVLEIFQAFHPSYPFFENRTSSFRTS